LRALSDDLSTLAERARDELTDIAGRQLQEIAGMALCKNVLRGGSATPDARQYQDKSGPVPQSDPTGVSRSGAIRMLRLAQVIDITGLGKTKIYELQSEGHFPMRVQITAHSVGWIEEEVQAWLARRVASSDALPARRHPKAYRQPSS
jgi:prophage regulatory protein